MGRTRPTTKSGDQPSIHSQPAPRSRPKRAHGDDGAALVEFALVMPILMLLLFGIFEFGLATNDYQSIRQGVRDGARQAVVAQYGSTGTCGLNGGAASASTTAQQNSQKVICTTKARTGLGNDVRVKVSYKASTGPGDYGQVRVCATRKAQSITGIIRPFLNNVNLRSQIDMRGEKALDLAPSMSETDPSNASWSWCQDLS